MKMEELKEIRINDKVVTEEELKEKMNDKNIRLVQEEENKYRILTRMSE